MENDLIYVFGHRHPDTDSICSSIAYADFLTKLGKPAEARRLGEINKETAFILDYFKVPVPQMLETVKTQVGDLKIDLQEKVSPDTTIRKVWNIMDRSEMKTLPVVDDNEMLIGIISLSDITKKFMDAFNYNSITAYGTTVDNITETINGTVISGRKYWENCKGKILVAAGQPEALLDFIEPGDIVISGDREDVQLEAIKGGAGCLVITCGHSPAKTVTKAAEEKGVTIIMTPLDTYTTVRLINQSIPVGAIMNRNTDQKPIVSFRIDDFVENIKDQMGKNRYRSYPVLDPEGKVCGFISRFHLISQRKKRVVLVDHNEKSQTCAGIEEAEILEIIDHHKIGDLTTTAPILFKNEPLGSTATIISNMYMEQGRRPSPQIAGILCAAIISDTLQFQSPTCTDTDRRAAERLAQISGIDIDEFAAKMFTAGSEFKGKTPKEIYSQDFKRVSFNDYHCGISQITILNMDFIKDEKPEIISYMNEAAVNDHFDLLALMITELSSRRTEMWITGKLTDDVRKELGMRPDEICVRFDRLMSRKKDVIPLIDSAIEKLALRT
ncbi:MAG: putative manganese-dependent inorganic diphosphatase [Clostridia bacterium]|nr:putative manganese-dependent inorganic diphosphatase [Clostridia bacterium]